MLAKEYDMIRWNVINFHIIQSIIITYKKSKTSQQTGFCGYKIDTSIHSNVMPIEMFKALYPDTKVTDLNKPIDKKIMYNELCERIHD